MKKYLLLVFIIFSALQLNAQIDDDDPYYARGQWIIKSSGGMIRVETSGLTRMLIPSEYNPATYTTEEKHRYGGVASFSFSTRIPNTPVYLQPEFSYNPGGASLHYNDINQTRYDITFDYHYFNVATGFRINPLLSINQALGGFHLNIGAQCGINVKDRLEYASAPDPTDDPHDREALQGVFRAKANWSGFFGFGYDYHFDNGLGFTLDARQYMGLSDVIETKPNGYYFSETKNQTKSYVVTLGITYPLNPEE